MPFPTNTYPGSIENAEDILVAINNFSTTCIGLVSAGQTGITILSATGLPASGQVSIDNEIIWYEFINNAGPNPVLSNCLRGFDSTAPAIHGDESRVEMRWIALNHNKAVSSILAIENELGVLPKGAYLTVADRLARNLPLTISMVLGTNWSFSHDRNRIVQIQLWRLNIGSGKYELFTAPIEQDVNLVGLSPVSILLSVAEEGFIIIN